MAASVSSGPSTKIQMGRVSQVLEREDMSMISVLHVTLSLKDYNLRKELLS